MGGGGWEDRWCGSRDRFRLKREMRVGQYGRIDSARAQPTHLLCTSDIHVNLLASTGVS